MRVAVLGGIAIALVVSCANVIDQQKKVAAPENIVTTINDANQVNISWDVVPNASSYSVEYFLGTDLGWSILDSVVTGTAASYKVNSLAGPIDSLNEISAYVKFRVRAKSSEIYSDYSIERSQILHAVLEDETTVWGTTQSLELVSGNTYRAKYYFKNTGNMTIKSIQCPSQYGAHPASDPNTYFDMSLQPSGSFTGTLRPGEFIIFYSVPVTFPSTPVLKLGVSFYRFNTL